VSSKQSSGDGISTPDDILNSYLDDLLGDENPLDIALSTMDSQIAPLAANAGLARVVPLPTKKVNEKVAELTDSKPKPGKAHLRAELPPVMPQTPKPGLASPESKISFVEPEVIQTQEQKLKLEKLLQSARTQLLVETPVAVPTEVVSITAPQPKTVFVNDPTEIQEWDIAVAEVVDVEIETSVSEEIKTGHFQLEGLEWLENGRPQWAQSRFDVLLFQVSGLTLAVPLIALGQIQPLTDELTPLFGQADWFMGLQPTPAGKIRTVNTARFVMPERYDESFVDTAKYVVSINGVPWGLAVDSVNQPITLEPEDVKWRGDRSKRPWLAGTVKDHMCALLDIPRIGQILIDADKNFVPA
jgi:purine-binding chemotaxis protein CheW